MPITQAGKTIIFEQFTDRSFEDGNVKGRLDFMLDPDMSDGDIINIEEELSVASYEEFLQKFKPVIYKRQLINTATGEVSFEYTLDEPPLPYDVIDVTQQEFYKMIMKIYEKKKTSGSDNFTFNYESVKKLLLPDKIVTDIKRSRREFEFNLRRSIEMQDTQPNMARKLRNKANITLNNLGKMLYSKDMSKLLPILMDDVQSKIDSYEKVEKENESLGISADEAPKLLACSSSFDKDGNLVNNIITSATQDNPDVKMLTSSQEQIFTMVNHHISQNCLAEIKENDFTKNAIMSVLCGRQNADELAVLPPKSELIERRDSYTRMYKLVQESFAKQMVSIVEKLVNIRAFFDHASLNGTLGNNERVIIANCTIADLMEDGKKDCFTRFMNFLGNQSNDNKIWYAVVPAVRDEIFKDINLDNISFELDNFGDNLMEDDTDEGLNTITYDDFKEYCDAVKDSKIMTFFNFKANESTGFSKLSVEIMVEYKEMCKDINDSYKKYSVLCYPNFTVLPKDQQRSAIGKTSCDIEEAGVIIHNGGEETVYIDTPSVYIDSSYIACGMMIAAHDKNNIKSKVRNAELSDTDYPAVRFDYEGVIPVGDSNVICKNIFTTKMNRELRFNISRELESAIGRFGFCFGSNEITINGNRINNTYVTSARTIADETVKNSDGTQTRQIQPIFKTIVGTFIEMLFDSYGKDINALNLLKNETARWSFGNYQRCINNPLYNVRYGSEADETEKVVYELIGPNRYKITVMYGPSPSEIEIETE